MGLLCPSCVDFRLSQSGIRIRSCPAAKSRLARAQSDARTALFILVPAAGASHFVGILPLPAIESDKSDSPINRVIDIFRTNQSKFNTPLGFHDIQSVFDWLHFNSVTVKSSNLSNLKQPQPKDLKAFLL